MDDCDCGKLMKSLFIKDSSSLEWLVLTYYNIIIVDINNIENQVKIWQEHWKKWAKYWKLWWRPKGNKPPTRDSKKTPPRVIVETPNISKDKISKDKIKEDNIIIKPQTLKRFEDSSFEYHMTKYFINKQIELQNPSFTYIYNKIPKEKLIDDWCDEIRKMKEIDKYTEKQISFIIKYLFENEFWRDQISTMKKFRKKNKAWVPYFVSLISEAKKTQQASQSTSIWAWITSY